VGAAYTYDFHASTSSWNGYPTSLGRTIKLNEADKYFGTYVAIKKDGNVTMVGENGTGQQRSRVFANSGTDWNQTHLHPEGFRAGVDIDDGVYMFSRGDTSFNYFDFHDSPSGSILFKAHASSSVAHAFESVTLYKDQVIGNRPDGNESLTMDFPCGIKPTHLVKDVWAIISVPCGDGAATIDDIFGDELGTGVGNYCQTDDKNEACHWVMYKDGPNYTGKKVDNVRVLDSESMELGKGYWIIADKNVTLKVDSNAVTSRTPLSRVTDNTVAGFYDAALPPLVSGDEKKIMVGNAFPRSFKWEHLEIETGTSVQFPAGLYEATGYVYDTTQTGQPYRAITANTPGISGEIKAYQGFWIKDLGTHDATGVKLGVPFEK
jgi:hypothetical protein